MDEPIIYTRWEPSSFLKKPARQLKDKLHNALILDDKDEFLSLINDPGFEPMQQYHRSQFLFLRVVNLTHILEHDAPQIAMAVLNGETKGIINDVELVFKDGWTPLHLASATPSPMLIKCLIERGDPVDVPCDYEPLGLKHATPLDLALEVIDYGYSKGFNTVERPWTPLKSIYELLYYVWNYEISCLEVIRLLVQNTEDKERVRKAFLDYAHEGKFVKLAALFLAAPELFLSSSARGDGGLSSIDALYVNLNSLDKTTDIQDGLLLLLDVFDLVGHMLIANLRVANQYEIGFFLREAAQTKLGISSPDDYFLRFFKPITDVYEPPPNPSKVDPRIQTGFSLSPFEKMKEKDIDIDYVNRVIPIHKPREAAIMRKTIETKLSTMSNIYTLFKKGEKQRFSSPSARSIEHMGARSFSTEAVNAKCRLNLKLNPRNGWKISRVMTPTRLESLFSSVRLSHYPMIAKCLIK